MDKLSVLLTTLCVQLVYGMALTDEMSNEISPLGDGNSRFSYKTEPSSTNYVKITQFPNSDLNKYMGEYAELYCEATGSPPPVIQWYKGNMRITVNEMITEDNYIRPHKPGLATVASRVVFNKVMPFHRDVYRCEAENEFQIDRRRIVLNVLNANGLELNVTDLIKMKVVGTFHLPRITFWAPVYLDVIGTDIILPCKSIGNPAPELTWESNTGKIITREEPTERLEILTEGGLSIKRLQWTDMGTWACRVRNIQGEDKVESFVYPMKYSK